MAIKAVLFDMDGTLIDSVYAHVGAWWQAFAECGVEVPHWEIHRRIGMDGDRLVDELLSGFGGEQVDTDAIAGRASALHSRYYEEAAMRVRPLPGARQLLHAVHERGLVIVVATTSSPHELDLARRVLDCDSVISAATTGDDVEEAKPDPTVVALALERAGVDADDAVFIGDATWDARAAGRAGVRAIAVRTGGIGDAELRSAGFARIVDTPAQVLAAIDELTASDADVERDR